MVDALVDVKLVVGSVIKELIVNAVCTVLEIDLVDVVEAVPVIIVLVIT